MTVSEGQPTLSVDPEASLRAELSGAIAAAQIDIANAIAELARSGADSAMLTNQGHALQQLQRTVGSANLGSLLALRSDVTIAISSATTLANQATSTAASAAAANANQSPAQRARANIEALGRDLFEKRVLDPYLQFASKDDEEAYRKRERERAEAYDRELAKHTLEGDRNAHAILQSQATDAKVHGAERSPHFAALEAELKQAEQDFRPRSQSQQAKPPSSIPPPSADSDGSLSDVMAALKAAGVEQGVGAAPKGGHGVTKIAEAVAVQNSVALRG
jgi:hypothetical protein